MRAVQIHTHDGPSAVRVADVPVPTRGPDEVLIEVRAAGVSFPEVLQTRGKYQVSPPLPFVPGAEIAGIVVDAPADSHVRIGDAVAAFSLDGGFAEYATAETERVFTLPVGTSFEKAASLPLNYLTSYFGLLPRGQLAPGESVLIQGAAGGMGTAAIQIAKAFGAGSVVGVVSTPEKGEIALAAGADSYVLAEGFKDSIRSGPFPQGMDVVFDAVGGDRFTDSLRCLKDDGRLLVVGFAGGEVPSVKVNRLLLNNIAVVGVGLGVYGFTRPGHVGGCWRDILPHIESGQLDPVIGSTHPLEKAGDALAELEERRAIGKVVLTT